MKKIKVESVKCDYETIELYKELYPILRRVRIEKGLKEYGENVENVRKYFKRKSEEKREKIDTEK